MTLNGFAHSPNKWDNLLNPKQIVNGFFERNIDSEPKDAIKATIRPVSSQRYWIQIP